MASTLITGSSGFLGRHLKEQLPDADGLDILPSKTTTIIEDVCTFDEYHKYDVIFHFAAITNMEKGLQNPSETYRVNIYGTIKLLKNFKGLLIYPSSFGVFNPLLCPYFLSKYVAEQIIQEHTNYIIFRLANPYGLKSNSVVNKFLLKDKIYIHGSGNQVRDFIYIDDAIAHFLSYQKLEKNQTYHIGSGKSVSVNTLASIVTCVTGVRKPVIHIAPRSFDIEKPIIRADLKCTTPIDEGIKKLLENMHNS